MIRIRDSRPDFDRACTDAYNEAVWRFGIDESGHAEDARFPRSSSNLHVKFVGYECSGSMMGQEMTYTFESWMECCDDE